MARRWFCLPSLASAAVSAVAPTNHSGEWSSSGILFVSPAVNPLQRLGRSGRCQMKDDVTEQRHGPRAGPSDAEGDAEESVLQSLVEFFRKLFLQAFLFLVAAHSSCSWNSGFGGRDPGSYRCIYVYVFAASFGFYDTLISSLGANTPRGRVPLSRLTSFDPIFFSFPLSLPLPLFSLPLLSLSLVTTFCTCALRDQDYLFEGLITIFDMYRNLAFLTGKAARLSGRE